MTKAFDRIMASLADAIAFTQGDTTRGRVAVGPACPGEGRGQGDPRQDPAQPGQVRRQPARPRRHRALLGAVPPLARCPGADAARDGRCGPEGGVGVD